MGPIGIFDSGYGGLTVFREIEAKLPQYEYIYLGDNARVPYGTRSFETVYQYTRQCVETLFDQGCPLVIVACNTASAKALRTIQQEDLPKYKDEKKVLGVIRPTAEAIQQYTRSGKVGILATAGTVSSDTYPTEIKRFFPHIDVFQQACPLWVPLIENGDLDSPAAQYYTHKYVNQLLAQCPQMDTIVMGCTHYPLLSPLIASFLPPSVHLLGQGKLVASSLADYLQRHPEVASRCRKGESRTFLTTDSAKDFETKGMVFFGRPIEATHFSLAV